MVLTGLRQDRALWWPAGLATLAWTLLWLAAYVLSGPGLDEAGRMESLGDAGGPQGLHLAQLAVWLGGLVIIGTWIETQRRYARQGARLEQARHESESRLDLLLRATEDSVLDADLTANTVLYCPPALAKLLDLPTRPARPILESWLDRVHKDDVVALKAAIRRHREGLSPRFEAEIRLLSADGQTHWYQVYGRLQSDMGGQPQRLLVVFREITGRKVREAGLRGEQSRLLAALAAVNEGVVCTDAEGNITLMNPMAERLTGWPSEQARGLPLDAVVTLIDEADRTPITCQNACSVQAGSGRPLTGPMLLIDRAGREFSVEVSASPLDVGAGRPEGVVVCLRDVTGSLRMQRQLAWQLAHDALTGLVSRQEFERRLTMALEDGRRNQGEHALLLIDLDHFKAISDNCGHLAGDELLKQVAHLLRSHIHRNDTLARLGGDQFAVLLENCPIAKAREIAEQLRETVGRFRFIWQDATYPVTASIGLTRIDPEALSAGELIHAAHSACHVAKAAGRDRVHLHSPADARAAGYERELQIVADIRAALAEDRFVLYAQAVQPLAQDGERHYEVLVRMVNAQGHLVSPGLFIPIAERNGLMPAVDRWVIRRALEMLATANAEGRAMHLFINLSGASLLDETLADFIREQMAMTSLDPARLCFEVTETAAVAQLATGVRFMRALQAQGCRFALDDFGSGMSSFVYLKNLPVDYLKIDGAFVRDMERDPVNQAFVETINHIGQLMGKRTIAEFVENEAILARLSQIGVDYVQGRLVGMSRPLDAVLKGL